MDQLPIGRSVEGYCEEMRSVLGSQYVALWLTYTLSDDEAVRLDRLDDAERLKAKGLNPSKL
jgi:hypothetical protein